MGSFYKSNLFKETVVIIVVGGTIVKDRKVIKIQYPALRSLCKYPCSTLKKQERATHADIITDQHTYESSWPREPKPGWWGHIESRMQVCRLGQCRNTSTCKSISELRVVFIIKLWGLIARVIVQAPPLKSYVTFGENYSASPSHLSVSVEEGYLAISTWEATGPWTSATGMIRVNYHCSCS